MFARELIHPRKHRVFAIQVSHECLTVREGDHRPDSLDYDHCTGPCIWRWGQPVASLLRDARKRLREKVAQGYVESARSLSRRYLEHDGKFWSIELVGAVALIQFGDLESFPGRRTLKHFENV